MVGPEIQTKPVQQLEQGEHDFRLNYKIRQGHYLVLSQCCDTQDRRILLAPLISANTIPWSSLSEEETTAFKINSLVITPGEGGGQANTHLDSSTDPSSRPKLILPGYFFLQPCPGYFADPQVVHFAMMRGIRKPDRELLDKAAEMTLESRAALRQRIAFFFGRIPEEDLIPEGQTQEVT